MASSTNVNIKMYRLVELGDCFLLRFSKGSQHSHVLIDCGSFRDGSESKARLKAIVASIKEQLDGKKLDVVIGTHQHMDHLSGFVFEGEAFQNIGIEQVWLPWLDDPADQDAIEVQQQHHGLVKLVARLPQELRGLHKNTPLSAQHSASLEKIEAVLGFYGIGPDAFAAKDPPIVPAEGVKFLKSAGENPPEYLSPGQVLDLPGLPPDTVKVYVLGPPKDYNAIKKTEPGAGETFDPKLAMTLENAQHFLSALRLDAEPEDADSNPEEDNFPFNKNEKVYLEKKFYDQYCDDKILGLLKKTAIYQEYQSPKQQWRTIEDNWIDQAENMALFLNDFTNNSSLVLAFELVKAKKVLLFVGDAQTGNWRSWMDVKWPDGIAKQKTDQLLANTVFYKVGHHASHNATFKPAFEKMKHPELAAMIPVEKTDPNITKKTNPWQMPAKNLYTALITQTHNRVLRMDDGIAEECRGKNPVWEGKIVVKELYVELNLK